jgi:hypothetical protein
MLSETTTPFETISSTELLDIQKGNHDLLCKRLDAFP